MNKDEIINHINWLNTKRGSIGSDLNSVSASVFELEQDTTYMKTLIEDCQKFNDTESANLVRYVYNEELNKLSEEKAKQKTVETYYNKIEAAQQRLILMYKGLDAD